MENVFILFALIGIVIVLFGNRLFPRQKSKSIQIPQTKIDDVKRRPFDADTAEILTSVVSGPAYVIDGDSIVIKKTQIRLYGVDAPELNHPYGKKAKWALVSLCKGQKYEPRLTS